MVAVITINFNLHGYSIPCINTILGSDYSDIKIYLIDNGSEQEDYEALQKEFSDNPKIKIVRIEKNIGYVGGVNMGLEIASKVNPDYYMIMNNDTIIDKSAIKELVNTAVTYNNRAIISGKVYYYDQPDIIQHTGVMFTDTRYLKTTYPGRNEKDTGQCDEEKERDSLDDVFWLLPTQVVKDTGYYCDYFFLYAEQGDYALRARRKGYRLIYTPKAKLWHKESMTSGGGNVRALPKCYWSSQGRFIFQYRNLKKKYFYKLMIKNFLKYSAQSVLFRGDERKYAIATLRGYFYGFRWMFNKRPNNGYNPYLIS
jgi:GT2 family glycosyltransferase